MRALSFSGGEFFTVPQTLFNIDTNARRPLGGIILNVFDLVIPSTMENVMRYCTFCFFVRTIIIEKVVDGFGQHFAGPIYF